MSTIHTHPQPPKKTTLLLSTTEDKASVLMLQALLAKDGWTESPTSIDTHSRLWHRNDNTASPTNIYLWQIPEGFLRADHLDKKWLSAHPPGEEIEEMIFLSRHAAASGRPSLTIHPIGNAGQPLVVNEEGEGGGDDETIEARAAHGGVPGRCVPPSPRMAPLFRTLYHQVQEAGLADSFEVTLEATHHGPWHTHPTMFVEIGSKEEDWGREDAAAVWAEVLGKALGLDGGGGGGGESGISKQEEGEKQPPQKLVVVGLGGGHYTPKCNDLLRHREDVLLGHVLASYCFTGPTEQWQRGVEEAIAATRKAYDKEDNVRIVAYLDKKSFKSAPRQELIDFLESKGVSYALKESEIK